MTVFFFTFTHLFYLDYFKYDFGGDIPFQFTAKTSRTSAKGTKHVRFFLVKSFF